MKLETNKDGYEEMNLPKIKLRMKKNKIHVVTMKEK